MASTALIGIAGVHYVAAELSRRGMVALPTIRNTSAYDIIVVTPDGRRHANIQVKASSKRRINFPMPLPEKVRAGRHDYYVLVRWLEREQRYEAFILSGRHAHAAVTAQVNRQKRRVKKGSRKGLFPGIHVEDGWRKAWEKWKL